MALPACKAVRLLPVLCLLLLANLAPVYGYLYGESENLFSGWTDELDDYDYSGSGWDDSTLVETYEQEDLFAEDEDEVFSSGVAPVRSLWEGISPDHEYLPSKELLGEYIYLPPKRSGDPLEQAHWNAWRTKHMKQITCGPEQMKGPRKTKKALRPQEEKEEKKEEVEQKSESPAETANTSKKTKKRREKKSSSEKKGKTEELEEKRSQGTQAKNGNTAKTTKKTKKPNLKKLLKKSLEPKPKKAHLNPADKDPKFRACHAAFVTVTTPHGRKEAPSFNFGVQEGLGDYEDDFQTYKGYAMQQEHPEHELPIFREIKVDGDFNIRKMYPEAYFLEQRDNMITSLSIPLHPKAEDPKFFFTTALSGCTIFLDQFANGQLVIYHANYQLMDAKYKLVELMREHNKKLKDAEGGGKAEGDEKAKKDEKARGGEADHFYMAEQHNHARNYYQGKLGYGEVLNSVHLAKQRYTDYKKEEEGGTHGSERAHFMGIWEGRTKGWHFYHQLIQISPPKVLKVEQVWPDTRRTLTWEEKKENMRKVAKLVDETEEKDEKKEERKEDIEEKSGPRVKKGTPPKGTAPDVTGHERATGSLD